MVPVPGRSDGDRAEAIGREVAQQRRIAVALDTHADAFTAGIEIVGPARRSAGRA